MRFDFDAYSKVYPEGDKTPADPIESAVDTFKPTEAEMATDKKPGAEVMETIPEEPKATTEAEVITALPEGEKDE